MFRALAIFMNIGDMKIYYHLDVDWWSLGVLLHTLVVGEFPFQVSREKIHIAPGYRPPRNLDQSLQRLLLKLLRINSAERIQSLSAYQREAYFADVSFEAIIEQKLSPLEEINIYKNRLIRKRKKELENLAEEEENLEDYDEEYCKHIVEEAVLKKVISESDSCLLSLCLAVEHCLLHGLRKRVFGLFGRATTFALLHKIAVSFPPAEQIFRKAVSLEKLSLTRKRHQSVLVQHEIVWIRLAITEKVLDIIVKYISENARKYYDENALMRDSVSSSMVAGLLVGICALEYTQLEVSKDDSLELNPCSTIFQQEDSYSDFHKKSITSPKPTLE
ncbi:RUN domain protein, partial [Trichinella nativa]